MEDQEIFDDVLEGKLTEPTSTSEWQLVFIVILCTAGNTELTTIQTMTS